MSTPQKQKTARRADSGAPGKSSGTSAAQAATNSTDPPGFEALLQDIMEHPERVLDENISAEEILELQKRLNPYAYVAGGVEEENKRTAAASFTNLREDYIRRFTMTSLVGFLFRMEREWEVPAEVRRWTPKKKARDLRGQETAPFTADEMVTRAQAVLDLARVAKEAEDEATKLAADAKAFSDEKMVFDEKQMAEGSAEVQSIMEEGMQLLRRADFALAKARGMKYTATIEMRKIGIECDDRLRETEAVARQHPEVREIIDNSDESRRYGGRLPAGQLEIPADAAKGIITNFLQTWFEFNPDAHVRSAYDEFVVRPTVERAEVPGLREGVLLDVADPERLPVAAVLAAAPTSSVEADAGPLAALTANQRDYNAACYVLRESSVADALLYVLTTPGAPERFRRMLFPVRPESEARSALEVIPPQDTFHRWNYYSEVNFEELRTATAAIYHDKPDLDWALILYEYFEGTQAEVDAALETFRDRHLEEVMSDIKAVDFGGWTLLGDFKRNRERVNIYNKHTDVLKRILDRHAEDKKLGGDLMRKRVHAAKARNIREAGPDAAGLGEYRVGNPSLQRHGAERVIAPEDMRRLERARGNIKAAKELEVFEQCEKVIDDLSEQAKRRPLSAQEQQRLKLAQEDLIRAREMLEVPDDAIQVDVWTHDTNTGQFGKSKFYTKAEAPSYIEEHRQRMQRLASGIASQREEAFLPESVRQPGASRRLAPFAQKLLADQMSEESAVRAAAQQAAADEDDGPPTRAALPGPEDADDARQ